MGIVDAFSKDDRVELTVNNLMGIMRSDALNEAKNQVLLNGIRAHLPYSHILIMAGENPTPLEETGIKREMEGLELTENPHN